jgi:DUF3025 family protein
MLRTMDWNPGFLARSPVFEPLRAHADGFGAGWPRLADLQRLLDRRNPPPRNTSGTPLRVVPQARRPVAFEDGYEPRLYLKGELQVRERSWHDLLNALVWLAFPLAKAALNERHYVALRAQRAAGLPNRGPAQDALTLFDEGGVIVASSDDELLACLRDWRWKDLFWVNRARLATQMRFRLFGHAVYEKALSPFLERVGDRSRGRRNVEQGPRFVGDATVEPAMGASSMPAPCASQGSDPKGSLFRPSTRSNFPECDGRGAHAPTVLPDALQATSGSHLPQERQALLRRPSLTSRGLLLKVEPGLLAAPLPEHLAVLDSRIAQHLGDERRVVGTRELAVVPLLGVPGWHAGNNVESFYDDTDYFRPRRKTDEGRGSREKTRDED